MIEQIKEGTLVQMGDKWVLVPPGVKVAGTDKELLEQLRREQQRIIELLELQTELLIQLVNQQSDATDLAMKLHRIMADA